jgi:hypothetical protein
MGVIATPREPAFDATASRALQRAPDRGVREHRGGAGRLCGPLETVFDRRLGVVEVGGMDAAVDAGQREEIVPVRDRYVVRLT